MSGIVEWVGALHVAALYFLIGGVAFLEGILPLIPGDIAVAFLAYVAARAGAAWIPTTLVIVGSSVAGNCVIWWLGRRFGTEWLARQMVRFKLTKSEELAEKAEHRIEDAYRRYGWMALFVARFVPGVRAMAPVAAGALRLPLWETIAVLAASSSIWYGVISWIAFKVGTDWAGVRAAFVRFGRDAGIAGTGLAVALVLTGWLIWHRRKARKQ